MMETDVEIGAFVCLYVRGGSACYHVIDAHWDEIDAALHQRIERGIDRVLALTDVNGADILLPVSVVEGVYRSTPDSRERQRSIDAAFKAEEPPE